MTGDRRELAGEHLELGASARSPGANELSRLQRAELLGRLAGGMAHDLNNCLATIRIHGDLALADLADETSIREAIEEIHGAAEHAGAMVRRLLSFGRAPRRRRSVVDLHDAVERAVVLLEHALPVKVELRVDRSAGEAAVLVDRAELDQVILNLALNASDAMSGCGILTLSTRSVDLAADDAVPLGLHSGSHVVLRVCDNGSGIEPAKIEHLLAPSSTTKEERYGIGLGLARVAEVVRGAGGAVSVQSEPGQGSSFEVFFPAAPEQPCDSPEEGRTHWSRGTETILVVEAVDSLRGVAARLLELQGYRVIRARSPSDARVQASAAGTTIDLLLADWDAEYTAREINSLPAQRSHPVKLLSMPSQVDCGTRRELEEERLHLVKPFGGEELLAAVRRVLDG